MSGEAGSDAGSSCESDSLEITLYRWHDDPPQHDWKQCSDVQLPFAEQCTAAVESSPQPTSATSSRARSHSDDVLLAHSYSRLQVHTHRRSGSEMALKSTVSEERTLWHEKGTLDSLPFVCICTVLRAGAAFSAAIAFKTRNPFNSTFRITKRWL
jgi:hypothetical protein